MSNKNQPTRRDFLKTTALATATVASVKAHSYSVAGANDRINTALIGCGGIAQAHLNALLGMRREENVDVRAVCDVYETRARSFQDQIWRVGGSAEAVKDHRRILEMKEVDAVAICTPEHWHARQALDALDAGKHVYCEKPMTHSVEEALALVDRVRQTGLKLQVNVQGMSDDSYSSAYEAIRAGRLGPVVAAQIDYVRNHPTGRGPWRTGVEPDLPKPPDLDWEAWLGQAPQRPWSAPRYYEWRNYKDYSGGVATDLFVHRLTRILKACGLAFPTRVVGMGGIYLWNDGRELPDNFEMLAEYPAVEGITPGMTVHILGTMANRRRIEHLIRGHKATLIFTSDGWEMVDEGSGEVVENHRKTGAESIPLHYRNFNAAIREGEALNCPVELGLYGVVAVAGANQSWFERRMLTWDAAARKWV